LDGTWRYAEKMFKQIKSPEKLVLRSLPETVRTAYPRRQEDCLDPERGLSSIEAIYVAYTILGRETKGLLDGYYWKDLFIEKNKVLLDFYRNKTIL
jgi:pre-rRNA-processing protein TSR3